MVEIEFSFLGGTYLFRQVQIIVADLYAYRENYKDKVIYILVIFTWSINFSLVTKYFVVKITVWNLAIPQLIDTHFVFNFLLLHICFYWIGFKELDSKWS